MPTLNFYTIMDTLVNKNVTTDDLPFESNSNSTELTLPKCLEAILKDYQENHDIMDDSDSFPQKEYDYVCTVLDITPIQAVLLAAILEMCVGGDATPDKIAKNLGCSNIHFIELRNEIDALAEKRYVRSSTKGFRGLSYRIPDAVLKSIQKNRRPDCSDISGLSSSAIIRKAGNYFRDFWRGEMDYGTLDNELSDLIRYNEENTLAMAYTANNLTNYSHYERVVFMYLLVRFVSFGEEQWGMEDYGRILQGNNDEDIFSLEMEAEILQMQVDGLVEFANNDGIADNSHLCLTDKTIESFLKGVALNAPKRLNGVSLISADSISQKDMFYNTDVQSQIDSLGKLLSKDNFDGVVERLKEKGLRCGFSCLFYGPAGTGKTETVNQISRATGRDIYLVDVSDIKSKWVGESEKNIKALFREYRKLVKTSKLCPILLFNEADAIFGVRKKGAENAVDKMENAVQNIILQEMESLEGILIATTNLTKNFDSAFERRFIYKIKFDKPDVEAKTKIWLSMIDDLDYKAAEALASEFDFSGGQIENISRKMTVEYILSGHVPDFSNLREYCLQETLDSPRKISKIGY